MRTRRSAVSGTDGSNDGWLVVVAAIAGAAAMWFYARSFRRGQAALALVAGLAWASTTICDGQNFLSADDGSEFEGVAQVGWSLNLAIGGSVALVVVGAIVTLRDRQHGTVPEAPAPPLLPE